MWRHRQLDGELRSRRKHGQLNGELGKCNFARRGPDGRRGLEAGTFGRAIGGPIVQRRRFISSARSSPARKTGADSAVAAAELTGRLAPPTVETASLGDDGGTGPARPTSETQPEKFSR